MAVPPRARSRKDTGLAIGPAIMIQMLGRVMRSAEKVEISIVFHYLTVGLSKGHHER